MYEPSASGVPRPSALAHTPLPSALTALAVLTFGAAVAVMPGCDIDGAKVFTPSLRADDVTADPADTVIIARAVLNRGGHLAVHASAGASNDALGEVLGEVALPEGVHTDVAVTLSRPAWDGERFVAALYVAKGEPTLDPGGEDPAMLGTSGSALRDDFLVTAPGNPPPRSLSVADQTVPTEAPDVVVVERVGAPVESWLVVFDGFGDGGVARPFKPRGWVRLGLGWHDDVAVKLDPAPYEGQALFAALVEDVGTSGVFEPGDDVDAPVLDGDGAPLLRPFFVSVPGEPVTPALTVVDQPDGSASAVAIASVSSQGPGWVTIYRPEPDGARTPLGQLFVQHGTVDDAVVLLDPPLAVAQHELLAVLHRDTGTPHVFEYVEEAEDSPDPPFFAPGGGAVSAQFKLTVVAEQYVPAVAVSDQLADGTQLDLLGVDSVTSDGPGWLAVYSDDDGAPNWAELRGFTPVGPGPRNNVKVPLTTALAVADTYHVVLHVQDGTDDFEFDGPDGVYDQPAQGPAGVVSATFELEFVAPLGEPSAVVYGDEQVVAFPFDTAILDEVFAEVDSLVVVTEAQGIDPLGSAFVPAGTSEAVPLTLDGALYGDGAGYLLAVYEDTNGNQAYDPGTDIPAVAPGALVPVVTNFVAYHPRLETSPQAVLSPGSAILTIDGAWMPTAGFVSAWGSGALLGTTYRAQGGLHGPLQIALAGLTPGESFEVIVRMHTDLDGDAELDWLPTAPDSDDVLVLGADGAGLERTVGVTVADETIEPAVSLPNPYVILEPSTLVVPSVTSPSPAWVVVTNPAADTLPDRVIGETLVGIGDTETVGLSLHDFQQPLVAHTLQDLETIQIQLHASDGDDVLDWDAAFSEGVDAPLEGESAQAVSQVRHPLVRLVGTNEFSSDLELSDSDVVEVEVRAPLTGWVAIHEGGIGDEDNPVYGEVLGQVAVPAHFVGVVSVELNTSLVFGDAVFAVLHVDEPPLGSLEWTPGGEAGTGDDVVAFVNQDLADLGEIVAVNEPAVTAPEEAFAVDGLTTRLIAPGSLAQGLSLLVAYADDDGELGEVVGVSEVLQPIPQVDVRLNCWRPLVDGEVVHVRLHEDTDGPGLFDPDTDTPVVLDGAELVASAPVSVPEGTPDVRVNIDAFSTLGTVFLAPTQVEPLAHFQWMVGVGAGAGNQPLTLVRGYRYAFVNPIDAWPLVFVSDTTADATVQLSSALGGSGPLAGDPTVDLVVSTEGLQTTTAFTASTSFEASVAAYRFELFQFTDFDPPPTFEFVTEPAGLYGGGL